MYQSEISIVIGTDSALSCPSMSPINQLLLLMNGTSDTSLHRWLFQAQVTPVSGPSYDVAVGNVADFCAFGLGESVNSKTLFETMEQISKVNPDVFRSGKRMNYSHDPSLESDLINVVQELATY
jgi:hypothetical protein